MKKKISILLLLFYLISLSLSSIVFAEGEQYTVTINVNNEFADPVNDISVSIGTETIKTTNGQAVFYGIPTGTTIYSIDTTDTIYREASGVINVASDVTENVTLELFEPLYLDISIRSDLAEGQMTFDEGKTYTSGIPLDDAIVNFDGQNFIGSNIRIDNNLELNKPYSIEISRGGFETITDTITLTDKHSSQLYDVNLQPIFEFTGNIYDAMTNELVKDAVLEQYNTYAGGIIESHNITDGQFNIQFPIGESFGFVADALGYEPTLSYRYNPTPGQTTYDFYLNPICGALEVQYLDSDNKFIYPSDYAPNLPMGDQTVTAKTFEGYELNDIDSKTVTLTEDNPNQIITFQYKVAEAPPVVEPKPETKGSITVIYQDSDAKVIDQEVKSDLPMGDQTVTAKTIEGYELNGVSIKSVVLTVDEPNQIIIFTYKKAPEPEPIPEPKPEPEVKGSITIKYLDDNDNILEQEVINDLVLGLHELTAKTFDEYELNDNISKSVTLTEENPTQVICFQYKKVDIPPTEPEQTPEQTPEPTPQPEPKPDKRPESKPEQEPVKTEQFGTVMGKAVDIYGNPISGLRIELHSEPRVAFTDENGEYAFYNVALGDHKIIMTDDRFKAASKIDIVVKSENSSENIIISNQTNAPLTLSEEVKDRVVDIIVTPQSATTDADKTHDQPIGDIGNTDTIDEQKPLNVELSEQHSILVAPDKPEEPVVEPQPEPEVIDERLPQTGDSDLLEIILLMALLLLGVWLFFFKKR